MGRGQGPAGDRKAAGLAFWSSILTQEGGDGAGFGHLLRKRALHVFDGGVRPRFEEKLYDLAKLARRC